MSQRTLVLNASYEPLAVVPLRRAVVLVLAEKAEVIESGGTQVRSENLTIDAPAVIKLRHFIRVPYKRRLPVTRRAVLQRDNHTCAYCHGKADTIDHVHPRVLGGRHDWRNVVAACSACNGRKGQKTLATLGWKLNFKPYEPAGTVALVVVIGTVEEAWAPYLATAG